MWSMLRRWSSSTAFHSPSHLPDPKASHFPPMPVGGNLAAAQVIPITTRTQVAFGQLPPTVHTASVWYGPVGVAGRWSLVACSCCQVPFCIVFYVFFLSFYLFALLYAHACVYCKVCTLPPAAKQARSSKVCGDATYSTRGDKRHVKHF